MTTTLESFKQAIELHRAGRLDEAERICRQILEHHPDNAHTLHLLGAICHQRGQGIAAVDHLMRAVMLDKSQPAFHSTLAAAQLSLGRADEAIRSLRDLLALRPDHAKSHNDLGVLLANSGQLDEAAECFRTVLRLKPDYGPAHNNLGNILNQQGRAEEASECFRAAKRASPFLVQAYNNLANSLKAQGKMDQAIAEYREALRIAPDYAEGHYNLGLALQGVGQFEEARKHFDQAIRLAPSEPMFQAALGNLLLDEGRLEEAGATADRVLAAHPNYAIAELLRSMVLLARGQLAEGWPAYESRLRCQGFSVLDLSQPRWNGEPLDGRTLLVHSEQGLGDTLQFIRYIKPLLARAPKTIVAVHEPLIPLLSTSGFAGLVSRDQPLPEFDVHVPLMSLPGLFGTTLDTIPRDVPYLKANSELVEQWRGELAKYAGFKVGIVWQGRPLARGDSARSIPLVEFAALAEAGVQLFSLQKGAGSEQLGKLGGRFEVVDLGPSLDVDTGAFMDTAAAMRNLDLVVTCDTAAAHLAGGLGVPVWVALSAAPEWRWLEHREESPWYPSMRLFRQTAFGQWADVFARMARELSRQLARAPRGDSAGHV
jgi:tetratricopeptide (TPR) repeat protein